MILVFLIYFYCKINVCDGQKIWARHIWVTRYVTGGPNVPVTYDMVMCDGPTQPICDGPQ